jgi:hypothetical protein
VTRPLSLVLFFSLTLTAAENPVEKGRALYDAAREAASGGKTLRDITYSRSTQFSNQGKSLTLQSAVQIVLPDASRTEVNAPGGQTILIYDGKSVMNKSTGQALPRQAADLQRRELARTFALFGPEPAEGTVRYRGEEQVDGRTADVIELFDVGDTPLRLYLDRETHDVLKRMYVGDAPDGTMSQVEEILSDYKAVGGIRWPHKMRTTRNGKPGPSSTVVNVAVNTGVAKADLLK